jgi:hypothetical protein
VRATRAAWAAALVAACAACRGGISDAEAVQVVRTYNAKKVEAYRAGDYQIVEPYVGEAEIGKLVGLIGVKLDQGITLDAELEHLEVLGVERPGREVIVRTDERWRYRDRRIGTGEQVGDASADRYRMRYVLARPKDRWVVERIEFAAEPEVGRTRVPSSGGVDAMHGVVPRAQGERREEPRR